MSQVASKVVTGKEALVKLGALGVLVAGGVQFFVGIQFFTMLESVELLSFVMIFVGGIFLIIWSLMQILSDMLPFKISALLYALISLTELILWFFIPPEASEAQLAVSVGNTIGLFGIFGVFVAIRPNFGPTANKKIYQAVAGILAFFIAILFVALGLYVAVFLDVADFAGRGTYPGDFIYTFVETIPYGQGIETYNAMRMSGWLMVLCSLYIMTIVALRNKISLKVASIGLAGGIVWSITNIAIFQDRWSTLNQLLYVYNPFEWESMLALKDPGVGTVGVILIIMYSIALMMMVYASFATKPIQQWRRKRDAAIAAAEVFFREGKLQNAIKYLERAAMLSSKIDEEDKAVELLTRIKQIRDKEIKMRKAKAAEKAKKALEKQKKAEAAKKAPKSKKGGALKIPKKSSGAKKVE